MIKSTNITKDDIFMPSYRGRLTEGLRYNASNNTLLWVDIIKGEAHRVSLTDESEASHQTLKFDDEKESIGAVALTREDDEIIICSKYGLAKGDFISGNVKYFLRYDHNATEQNRLRSNDAIIDPWGHLWVGVMTDFPTTLKDGQVSPEGRLYKVDCHDLKVETMIENSRISNGLGFSNDSKEFYWTDSLTHIIWKFDYNFIGNKLTNRRVFVDTTKLEVLKSHVGSPPEPDGMIITTTNEVFSAIFGTGKVLHFDQSGNCVEEFVLPCERITCVAIGGKNHDELFVSTGHLQLDDFSCPINADDLSEDLGGFLFRIKLSKSYEVQNHTWGGK